MNGGGMDVVLKLRELRRLHGLTQREVAQKSGVGDRTISSFESGARIDNMKLSQLRRILAVYGVNEGRFFSAATVEELIGSDAVQATADPMKLAGLLHAALGKFLGEAGGP